MDSSRVSHASHAEEAEGTSLLNLSLAVDTPLPPSASSIPLPSQVTHSISSASFVHSSPPLTSHSTLPPCSTPLYVTSHSSTIIPIAFHLHASHSLATASASHSPGHNTDDDDSDYTPDNDTVPSNIIIGAFGTSSLTLAIKFHDPASLPLPAHLFSDTQLELFGIQHIYSINIPASVNIPLCTDFLLGTHPHPPSIHHIVTLLGLPPISTYNSRMSPYFPNITDIELTTHVVQFLSRSHPSFNRHFQLLNFLLYFILFRTLSSAPSSTLICDPSRILSTRPTREAFYVISLDKPYPLARLLFTSLKERAACCGRRA